MKDYPEGLILGRAMRHLAQLGLNGPSFCRVAGHLAYRLSQAVRHSFTSTFLTSPGLLSTLYTYKTTVKHMTTNTFLPSTHCDFCSDCHATTPPPHVSLPLSYTHTLCITHRQTHTQTYTERERGIHTHSHTPRSGTFVPITAKQQFNMKVKRSAQMVHQS